MGVVRYGLFFSVCVGYAAVAAAVSFVNFETPPVHPMDMSPDGNSLAVCNLPDARLMLFDISTATPVETGTIPVGYDPVSVRYRTNTEVWVVNHLSDSVSVIDLTSSSVIATLETLDEPCDVVFAGTPERAFVSCSQANTILVFDPANLAAAPTEVAIAAEEPKALAVSTDGSTVYAAIFESGNSSTLISGGAATGTIGFPPNDAVEDPSNPYAGVSPPPNDGANFNPPINGSLPSPPQVGHIVKKDGSGNWMDDNGADWTSWITGADSSKSGRYAGWDLVDRDVAVIDANALTVTYAERLMNICMAIGVNPATGEIAVVGTDATNEIRFEPVINGTFVRVNIGIVDGTNLANTSVVDLNGGHLTYASETVPQATRDQSIGDPRAIVWNAAGNRGYISGMGSNNLVVVQANGQRVTTGATVEVGEGPTGLVLDEARDQLYVLNRFEGSISVVDASSESELTRVAFYDPTPEEIKIGRKHLYDTHKTSGLGQVACASCHVDSRMDRLAWDLGDPSGDMKAIHGNGNPPQHNLGGDIPGLNTGFDPFHPMKGPMVTQTLQDIIGKEPLHWRGDRDGLEEFNPAFTNLQGDDSLLTPQEMDEYEDFLASIHFPPNPFRELDNSIPTSLDMEGHTKTGRFGGLGDPLPTGDAQAGLDLYRDTGRNLDSGNLTCVVCHTLPLGSGTDSAFNGSGFDPIPPGPNGQHHLALVSNDGLTNKSMKIPQLRNLYEKVGFELTPGKESLAGFGFLHDGAIDTIAQFVAEPVFIVQNDQEVADLTALMLAFSGSGFTTDPNEPPGVLARDAHAAVGKQVTLTSSSKSLSLFNDLEALAQAGAIDLVAKTNDGANERGWTLLPGTGWQPDAMAESAIATSTLLAVASPSMPLTFTALPTGLGTRFGVDRDEDDLLDFDEIQAGSKSTTPDTDDDGLSDFDEVATHGTRADLADSDGDGLDDPDELFVYNTNAVVADTDDDNLSDGDEVNSHGTDPNLDDSDSDGLTDGQEVLVYFTEPNQADTDGDGVNDGDEVLNGTDPLVSDLGGIPSVPSGAPFAPWALVLLGTILAVTGATRLRAALYKR